MSGMRSGIGLAFAFGFTEFIFAVSRVRRFHSLTMHVVEIISCCGCA